MLADLDLRNDLAIVARMKKTKAQLSADEAFRKTVEGLLATPQTENQDVAKAARRTRRAEIEGRGRSSKRPRKTS